MKNESNLSTSTKAVKASRSTELGTILANVSPHAFPEGLLTTDNVGAKRSGKLTLALSYEATITQTAARKAGAWGMDDIKPAMVACGLSQAKADAVANKLATMAADKAAERGDSIAWTIKADITKA